MIILKLKVVQRGLLKNLFELKMNESVAC